MKNQIFKEIVNYRSDCRVCSFEKLIKIIDLGKMPLAGGFVKKKAINKKELKIPLELYYCENCKLVQVKDSIDPEFLFNSYNYSSSDIPSLNKHFIEYGKKIKKYYKNRKLVKLLEFGSNDGVLLKEFLNKKNFFCIGVDPSKNISNLAKRKGINIIQKYFNLETSKEIDSKYNKFDYITGSNVFAHINDIHTVVKAAKLILKKNGLLVIEVHYLLDLIKLNQYDFFYHEHLNYYTIVSLSKLFSIHKLKLIDFEKISTHGGSIRVFVSPNINKKKSDNLKKIIKYENKINIKYFNNFNQNINNQKKEILKILDNFIRLKKNIVGFGASGRGTIFLNYCKINKKHLNYIIDGSPLRAGKFMPGVGIPIYGVNYFIKNNKKVDFVLIIAWNYADSIMKQVKRINKNIKFIVPFPYPIIL